MTNATRIEGSETVVKRTTIIGTDLVYYTAWEPTSIAGPHSTITTIDGRWYGRIGTARCEEAEALPGGSPERRVAYNAHRQSERRRAEEAILAAIPALRGTAYWLDESATIQAE